MVLGVTLGLAVVGGAAACGSSSSKTNSGTTPATVHEYAVLRIQTKLPVFAAVSEGILTAIDAVCKYAGWQKMLEDEATALSFEKTLAQDIRVHACNGKPKRQVQARISSSPVDGHSCECWSARRLSRSIAQRFSSRGKPRRTRGGLCKR